MCLKYCILTFITSASLPWVLYDLTNFQKLKTVNMNSVPNFIHQRKSNILLQYHIFVFYGTSTGKKDH